MGFILWNFSSRWKVPRCGIAIAYVS